MQSTTEQDNWKEIEMDARHTVYSILFSDDGKHMLSSGKEGLVRWWRMDGGEVDEQIAVEQAEIYAAALSPNQKWLVCGLKSLDNTGRRKVRVRVWNAQTHEEVLNIGDHTDTVFSVDVSPDSSKFATGSGDRHAFIWNIETGQKLVGPLEHQGKVVAVRFSPRGDRIATATAENPDPRSIRTYDANSGQLLLDIPFSFKAFPSTSSCLSWCADGRHILAAAHSEVQCFSSYSGSLRNKWRAPGGGQSPSVVPSHSQKFVIVASYKSISFWDASTQEQIGTTIERSGTVWSLALSPNDDYFTIGEGNGKIALFDLRNILPVSYLTVRVSDQYIAMITGLLIWDPFCFSNTATLPLMYIGETVLNLWTKGSLTCVEELLTEEIEHHSDAFHHAHAFAQRALLRTQLKCASAIDDAKKSIETQRSVLGYIAMAIACIHNGENASALRAFDLVFSICCPSETHFLLLIKAILMFTCGKHDDALLRIDDLIDIVENQSLHRTARAQMHFLLGRLSSRTGNHKEAMESFKRAQEAIPFQQDPYLDVISLLFGWDFVKLPAAIHVELYQVMNAAGDGEGTMPPSTMVYGLGNSILMNNSTAGWDWDPDVIQKCFMTCESNGDAAMLSNDFHGAILQYSTALSLNPSEPVNLLVKRSKARALSGLLEDALEDADEAIRMSPLCPWGHEQRHKVLHASQRYGEAIDSFSSMYSLIEKSTDPYIRQQGQRYISPKRSGMTITSSVQEVSRSCPLVLIDVRTGCLCDESKRMRVFKSEPDFKALQSSLTETMDEERVQGVVEKYFRYVALSHVWEGEEPSFQDVSLAGSVRKLDSSPLNEKLRRFCEVVRADRYHWAWSDTCCIDKTVSTVLNQSLTMMYKWYRASVATFVYLVGVGSPSILGGLTGSIWMTRAWTAQEILAARVVRFYTDDWKPYLGDTRQNHKESPEVMQELRNAIGVSHETILAFDPDSLTVREKLRLASRRRAKLEEDMAYSLIGIFKSDIIPRYGEGEAALGHLLEEIVTRSSEVTVFAWNGASSSYNSCLPSSLLPYAQPPGTVTAIDEDEMEAHVTPLRLSLPQTVAILVYKQITELPLARFANRRLYLPCIMFTVRKLSLQNPESVEGFCYQVRASGIRTEFQTTDRLSSSESRKYALVHPWIRDLRDPFYGIPWRKMSYDDDYDSDETNPRSELTSPAPRGPVMDDYTRALRLIARLQQNFHALLLQQQPNGEFKRVAADCDIIVPGIGIDHLTNGIRAEVVQIL